MDRQLLLAFLIVALVGGGCNRGKAPPQAEAVRHKQDAAGPGTSDAADTRPIEYRPKTTIDFEDDTVTGNLAKPSGGAFDQLNSPSPAPSAAAIGPPSMADSVRPEPAGDLEIATQRRIQAEEQRRRVLAEVQERASVMGAFGGQQFGDSQQPNPLSGLGGVQGANPLRGDAVTAEAPQPMAGNPLRESRIGAIAPPAGLGGSSISVPMDAAPHFGAAGDIERFARIVPAPAGGASIEPRETRAAGSAAPTITGPTIASPVPPLDDGSYEVVEVYYGTDRQSAEPPPNDWQHVVRCFWPTASVGFMAVCLTLVAVGRRSWLVG